LPERVAYFKSAALICRGEQHINRTLENMNEHIDCVAEQEGVSKAIKGRVAFAEQGDGLSAAIKELRPMVTSIIASAVNHHLWFLRGMPTLPQSDADRMIAQTTEVVSRMENVAIGYHDMASILPIQLIATGIWHHYAFNSSGKVIDCVVEDVTSYMDMVKRVVSDLGHNRENRLSLNRQAQYGGCQPH